MSINKKKNAITVSMETAVTYRGHWSAFVALTIVHPLQQQYLGNKALPKYG